MAEFQELSDVEQNAELYYAELSNEEDNLKQVLDMRLKLNKALSEEALQLESKLEIVTKNVELLGIELMQKKLNALNQTIKEVEERSNCLFDDTIHYSSQVVTSISGESRKLDDMRKAYNSPEVVANSVKTATVKLGQAQQALDGSEKELKLLQIQQSAFKLRVDEHDLKIMDWILADAKLRAADQIKLVNGRNEQMT